MEPDNAPTSPTMGLTESKVRSAADALAIAYNVLGLKVPSDTPLRVARWLSTYVPENGHELIHDEWIKTFESEHGEVVLTQGMAFTALCEHHLLPFRGQAAIAYIPHGKVLGLSKFARLLQVPVAQPTLQEDITTMVADAIMAALEPRGVMVVLYNVEHTCMTTRGVKDPEARTTTSAVRGVFREAQAARAEVLGLLIK